MKNNIVIKAVLCIYTALLLMIVTPFDVNAQAYDFRSVTVSDGLPHGSITDIHHAKDGFIWLGTIASGLVRYNGDSFQRFGVNDGLRDDMVTVLFEDSRETLWVATYNGGVARMEGDSLHYPFEGHLLDEVYVMSILESPDGNVWFGTFEEGVFIYDGDGLERITREDGLVNDTVWDVHWEGDTVWIATHNGLSVFDGETFRNYTADDGISGEKIFRIVDYEGEKWLATSRGVTIYDGESFTPITEINGRQLQYVYDLIKDSEGKIWIGMESDGVYWYENDTFTHITRANGLVSDGIYILHEDRNQNVWVGTSERGISIYRGEGFRFYNSGNGLIADEILSLYSDGENKIWIGTDNGLQSYNGEQFRVYELPVPSSGRENIWDIEQFANGNLLILLDDSTILEYDGNEFSDYSAKIGLEGWFIYEIKIDSKGIVWVGTDAGLLRVDGSEFTTFGTEDGLPGPVIYHVFESEENDIWIATNSGVGRFNGEEFTSIRVADGLGHYNVNYITQDPYGDFWIGTSAGVTHFKPGTDDQSAVIRNFGEDDGMKLVETLSLWFDSDGYLWQGTNGGIHRLNVANYRQTGDMVIEHYRFSNRGIGVEAMHKSVSSGIDNTIWFGTMEGIIILDTENLQGERTPPHLYIDDIRFNAGEIEWGEYSELPESKNGLTIFPEVEFPYGNNTISFSFSALEYFYPENVEYRYKLEGFDEQWNPATGINTAQYTNLSPGDYEFKVQARNGTGAWGADTAGYSFSISYPFWQTFWFWGLVAVFAVASIAGLMRIRLNILERDKLSRLVDEQTKSLKQALDERGVLLKEVHHRVKNNLAVIYSLLELQSQYLEGEKNRAAFNESKLRVRSIALVHEKLYQNDDLSKIEAKKYISELVEVISDSVSNPQTEVQLNLDIDDTELTLDQGIPCGLLLNELISNAYKHAFTNRKSGNVDVHFKERNGSVCIKVSDDGKGMPDGFQIGETDSLGLVLVQTLTSQIDATLSVNSDTNGSTFAIEFEKDNGNSR